MKTLILVMTILFQVSTRAGDAATPSLKTELQTLLRDFNRMPEPDSPDAYMGHPPAWVKPEWHKLLETFIAKYPNTEEALTAELWLTWGKTVTDQTATGEQLKEKMHARSKEFKRIEGKSLQPWQAKIARLARVNTLQAAHAWEDFYVQMNSILSDISSYINESHEEYRRFLQAAKTPAEEIEPILRESLIVAACYQGKLDEALKRAEELQAKFPEWSKRNRIHGAINQLKSGHSPYRPR